MIILTDDLGYGDLSCYGNSAYKTPHLDRLASEGLRFLDFHSSGAVCSPTRAGLLTGRYQQRAGVPGVIFADPKQNRHHGLHAGEVTFAELLKTAGYATAVIGKWHLGYEKKFNPRHHGFDRFRGYVSGNVDYISHFDRMGVADWWDGLELSPEQGYSTHLITRHAIDCIQQHKDGPFCLYIAHECPHSPYQAPGDKPVRDKGRGRIPGAARKDIPAAYRQMVTEMDKGVGEVVATLKRLNLAQNTLVFFFSDNGANRNGSNGPLRGFKGGLWEGGHRVPAIAWRPGKIKPGTTRQTAISLDLTPTMLDLAGVKRPADLKLDGVSLRPVLAGQPLAGRTLFWEYRGATAVRQGPWKLVAAARGQRQGELFNLDDDLAEKQDLAARQSQRVKALTSALKRWQQDVAQEATRQPGKR